MVAEVRPQVAQLAGTPVEAGERLDVLVQENREKLVRALDQLNEVLSRTANVLNEENQRNLSAILRNVRAALDGHGRLLVVNEQIIPPGNEPHPGKLGDIMMLLIGGRERTEAEWRSLFEASGFALTRVVPLPSLTGAGVIEGIPSGG